VGGKSVDHNTGYKFTYGKLSTTSTMFSTFGIVEAVEVPEKSKNMENLQLKFFPMQKCGFA
jgi:hypothetical protein